MATTNGVFLDCSYVILILVASSLMMLVATVTSQCVPVPPCRTCGYVSVERDDKDCNRYFYCYYGRLWSNMRCGTNQIYSRQARACVYRDTTDECRTGLVQPVAPVAPPPQGSRTNRIAAGNIQSPPTARVTTQTPRPRLENSQFSQKCGVKSSNWIVGGRGAEPGEWAWQVSLQVYHSGRFVHYCGATLVHESWIVTAAHCIYGMMRRNAYVIAVMGAYNLTFTQPDQQKRQVVKAVPYPGYRNYGNFPHDIAALQLSAPVKLSRSVSVACLPPQGQDPVAVYAGGTGSDVTGCWVTGWGITLEPGRVQILNEIKLDLVDQSACAKRWAGYLMDFHMCAGKGNTGACRGDSGGPLVCTTQGRFYLEGVVSWGEDTCLLSGYPNVFTRVSLYSDWIRNVIARG